SNTSSSGTLTGYPALPGGVTVNDLSTSVYNNTVYLWVLGSDGYVYQSIGGGTFTVVSTAGADHIFAWPGQNLATYS
ncbi:hypothetical protein ACQUFE_18670, partial [Enterococcus casseliflavus]|uniref:hypothetical protein n=1 Tax=Enterococcus casseliflavus TaxID=37734 RepID=UPI003D0D61B5